MVLYILSNLQKEGVLDNTYIFYNSDHGVRVTMVSNPICARHPANRQHPANRSHRGRRCLRRPVLHRAVFRMACVGCAEPREGARVRRHVIKRRWHLSKLAQERACTRFLPHETALWSGKTQFGDCPCGGRGAAHLNKCRAPTPVHRCPRGGRGPQYPQQTPCKSNNLLSIM